MVGKVKFFLRNIPLSFRGGTITMRRRLLAFQLILTLTILSGTMLLLSVTGMFSREATDSEKFLGNELYYLSESVESQFGKASALAVRLSESLSAGIEDQLKAQDLTVTDLKTNPEILHGLVEDQLPSLIHALDGTDCTGAFFALDATVGPDLPGAKYSKAGLYIRNNEPSANGGNADWQLLLRGSSELATKGELYMQSKWDLEYDVENCRFWSEPLAAYQANPSLPASRLVYWCPEGALRNLDENTMTCSVPLIGNDGRAFGVCGFEVSQMNFMLRHNSSNSGKYPRMALLLANNGDGGLMMDTALLAGNATVYGTLPKGTLLKTAGADKGLTCYSILGGGSFIGLSANIRLYPDDSPFASQSFTAAAIVPKADFDAAKNASSFRIALLLFALMAVGIVASVILSMRYAKPITDKLMSEADDGLPEKTNILEIDLIIDKIREQRSKDTPLPDDLFGDFIARIGTLTQTERKIFRHYAAGKSVDEILSFMYISMSTLKTHNGHIYAKLGITSKDELTLYAELIKKSGLEDRLL
ncbi:response regulator transcription factor [Diplocloster modestus]|uniref:LuxR C-terminal-related transcriptional regulator n=1 Tax=Diplocloster modestus TaxID=2850322 RepID=A0ABS6KD63_9FIRM|nr:LuxR C-terminal-related transcriptional regulator [Diplocloster modestus]MBU9728462.1 LuxR C-terminal-related transcriptional regulator [Diplocloster modestus]